MKKSLKSKKILIDFPQYKNIEYQEFESKKFNGMHFRSVKKITKRF
jgi:hypothetical protein